MSKFKVGDEVRVVRGSRGTLSKHNLGRIAKVAVIMAPEKRYDYTITFPGPPSGPLWILWVFEDELEFVTKENPETPDPYWSPNGDKVLATVRRILDSDESDSDHRLKRIADLLEVTGYLGKD
jgi:hypothetical protein